MIGSQALGISSQMSAAKGADKVRKIVPLLSIDARRAIMSMQYLRSSNKPVVDKIKNIDTPAADGHDMSQNAFRMLLVLELARVFDEGSRSPDEQNKASLPILSHYIARKDVICEIICNSDKKSVREAAAISFLNRWNRFSESDLDRDIIRRLKQFRNWRVGHTLLKSEPEAPTYAELFRLVAIVSGLSLRAEIFSGCEVHDYLFTSSHYRTLSNEFWIRFVAGVRALDQSH